MACPRLRSGDRRPRREAPVTSLEKNASPIRSIAGDCVLLEPQTAAHAGQMFVVLGDPAIYEHENEPPPSGEWLRERFARLESRRSADGSEQWLNWVVRLPGSDPVGYVQATIHANGAAAIAYVFSARIGVAGSPVERLRRCSASSPHTMALAG